MTVLGPKGVEHSRGARQQVRVLLLGFCFCLHPLHDIMNCIEHHLQTVDPRMTD